MDHQIPIAPGLWLEPHLALIPPSFHWETRLILQIGFEAWLPWTIDEPLPFSELTNT
jgi:hypothetical protein